MKIIRVSETFLIKLLARRVQRRVSPGQWNKIYKAGYLNNNKVEIHYFRNNTNGQLGDVKIKYELWHQKQFKNIIP